jgi:uncharacterized membrane protein YeaQ/YmgE (transglycosylase-associated protein family)
MQDIDMEPPPIPDERPPTAVIQDQIYEASKETKKYWTLGLIMGALLGILGNLFVSGLFTYQVTNNAWYIVVAFGAAIILIVYIWLMLKFLEKKR